MQSRQRILKTFAIIKIYFLKANILKELLAKMSSHLSPSRLEKILNASVTSSRYILPVLEDVYQHRNAAAIIRSTEANGIHEVVALQEENVFIPNLNVTKGADTWVHIHRKKRSPEALFDLRDQGYQILGVSPGKEAISLPDFIPERPVALIFGTEKKGLSDELLEVADAKLCIPMYGFTESYNVSVAAAICLYDLKQKLLSRPHFLEGEDLLKLQIRWAVRSARSGEEVLRYYIRQMNQPDDWALDFIS